MDENKNRIIVYRDWIGTFDALTDEEAGKLIKHFFRYINDQNPEAPDRLIALLFEPMKQTLKRDLKAYQSICEQNRENVGIRWNKKDTTVYNRIRPDTKHTDSDIDSDIDKDIDKDTKNKKKRDFDFSFLSEEHKENFMRWIKYKKSRNEMYKTQDSLQACYRNILKLSMEDPNTACEIIDQSMGNNWAGLFPLKKNDSKPKNDWEGY